MIFTSRVHEIALPCLSLPESDPTVFQHIAPELKDSHIMHAITDGETYTKTFGIEWNSNLDHFRLTIADLPPLMNVTKHLLVSDIAKTFDLQG